MNKTKKAICLSGILFLIGFINPANAEIAIIDETNTFQEQLECVDYSTIRDKTSTRLIKPDDIDNEIKNLGDSGIYCLRVFSTDRTLPFIFESVKKYNESTVDQDIVMHPVLVPLHNASELKNDKVVLLVQANRELVDSVVVGNGALDETIVLEDGTSKNLFTDKELTDNIIQAKEIFKSHNISITTAESPENLMKYHDIVENVDYATVLYFPFYETDNPDKGLENIFNSTNKLQKQYPNTEFYVVSGWPSSGTNITCTQSSGLDQNKFIKGFIRLTNDHNLSYSLFAAYDESWKSYTKLWIKSDTCNTESLQILSDSPRKYGLFYQNGVLKLHNINLVGSNLGIIPSNTNLWQEDNKIMLEMNPTKDEYQVGDFGVVNIDAENFDGLLSVSVFNKNEKIWQEDMGSLPHIVNYYSSSEDDLYENVRIEMEYVANDVGIAAEKNSVLPFAYADNFENTSMNPTFHITYAILSPNLVCNGNSPSCSYVDIMIPLSTWIIPAIVVSGLSPLTYPIYRTASKIYRAKTEFTKEERPFGTTGFVDIENSTAIFAQITTSQRKKILQEYYSTLKDILRKYDENTMIKELGDGILFYFKDSCNEKEFDFKKVIYSCKEIIEKCGSIHLKLKNGEVLSVNFRISLVHGPLDLFENNDVVGSAVDLAAKINEKAINGKIAINSNLHKLLSMYNSQSLGCEIRFDKIGHKWTDDQHRHEILSMNISEFTRRGYHT